MGLNCFNENGILRVQDRNDHIHAVFSEEFEKNLKTVLKLYSEKKLDKFASAYEIEKASKEINYYKIYII